MDDNDKTKKILIEELAASRRGDAAIEKRLPEGDFIPAGTVLSSSKKLLETIIDTAPT